MMMTTGDISLADAGRRVVSSGTGPQAQADTGAPQRRREDDQMFLNGGRTTADMAGGEFYQVTGTPDRFFERIRTAASAIYRLAVEVPSDTPPGKDFTLAARVLKRSGVTARANRHAVAAAPSSATAATAAAPPARAPVSPVEQMRRAIASGRAMNGIDVSIEGSVRRAADPAQVSIDVIERVIVPEPVDGALRAEAEFVLDSLPPGNYTIRATVLSGVTVLGSLTRPVR
jgi:hypothetical protein